MVNHCKLRAMEDLSRSSKNSILKEETAEKVPFAYIDWFSLKKMETFEKKINYRHTLK